MLYACFSRRVLWSALSNIAHSPDDMRLRLDHGISSVEVVGDLDKLIHEGGQNTCMRERGGELKRGNTDYSW